jgi:hypothetical protein
MAAQDRIATRNWELYDPRHVVHQPALLPPDELKRGCDRAYESFYHWSSIVAPAAAHGSRRHRRTTNAATWRLTGAGRQPAASGMAPPHWRGYIGRYPTRHRSPRRPTGAGRRRRARSRRAATPHREPAGGRAAHQREEPRLARERGARGRGPLRHPRQGASPGRDRAGSDPAFQSALRQLSTRCGANLGLDAVDLAPARRAANPGTAGAVPGLRRQLTTARRTIAETRSRQRARAEHGAGRRHHHRGNHP